jgi:hypothetical protein
MRQGGAVGVYDQAGRYAIKRRPSAFFTWRAPPLWLAWKFLRWQDTRTLPFTGEPDRVCDTVAEFEYQADPRQRCLVDVEVRPNRTPTCWSGWANMRCA